MGLKGEGRGEEGVAGGRGLPFRTFIQFHQNLLSSLDELAPEPRLAFFV